MVTFPPSAERAKSPATSTVKSPSESISVPLIVILSTVRVVSVPTEVKLEFTTADPRVVALRTDAPFI